MYSDNSSLRGDTQVLHPAHSPTLDLGRVNYSKEGQPFGPTGHSFRGCKCIPSLKRRKKVESPLLGWGSQAYMILGGYKMNE